MDQNVSAFSKFIYKFFKIQKIKKNNDINASKEY